MPGLVRKNLIVNADELRALARQRGTSESEAVRQAVRQALAGQEMVDALQGLHDIGAFADYEQLFGSPPAETASPGESSARL
jgi:hypothetical protein